jgi:hypothetical protein
LDLRARKRGVHLSAVPVMRRHQLPHLHAGPHVRITLVATRAASTHVQPTRTCSAGPCMGSLERLRKTVPPALTTLNDWTQRPRTLFRPTRRRGVARGRRTEWPERRRAHIVRIKVVLLSFINFSSASLISVWNSFTVEFHR